MTLLEIYFKSLEEGITDVPFHTVWKGKIT